MRDLMHQNFGNVGGTPVLTSGPFTDGSQALAFPGTTAVALTIPDSTSSSLAVADGAAGGMALETWFRVSALPVSTSSIVAKAGSYSLQLNPSGNLIWGLANGANQATVTSVGTVTPGEWYQAVGVYNGDYTGAGTFGGTTTGGSLTYMLGDYDLSGSPPEVTATGYSNLQVGKFNILEKGLITSIGIDMVRTHDATFIERVAPVIYQDEDGAPGAKIAQGNPVTLDSSVYTTRQWITFPVAGGVQPGPVWIGWVAGWRNGQMRYGYDTSGGYRRAKPDTVTDTSTLLLDGETPDNFGTASVADNLKLAMYANYTPTGRTGDEGFAVLYMNGQFDSRATYTHGIADVADNTLIGSGFQGTIAKTTIWAQKLTSVQVATHYNAR